MYLLICCQDMNLIIMIYSKPFWWVGQRDNDDTDKQLMNHRLLFGKVLSYCSLLDYRLKINFIWGPIIHQRFPIPVYFRKENCSHLFLKLWFFILFIWGFFVYFVVVVQPVRFHLRNGSLLFPVVLIPKLSAH